jgi:tRNA nucleotidyltransferase (CCA-adding enzyme)
MLLQRYAVEWQHVQPTLDGNDLRRLGLASGPAYRTILSALRRAWLDGEVTNEAEERALAVRLVDV